MTMNTLQIKTDSMFLLRSSEERKQVEQYIGHSLPDEISWNDVMPIVIKVFKHVFEHVEPQSKISLDFTYDLKTTWLNLWLGSCDSTCTETQPLPVDAKSIEFDTSKKGIELFWMFVVKFVDSLKEI